MQDLTVLVKTFERPCALGTLLASLGRRWPGLPVLVGDDSADPGPAAAVCRAHGAGFLPLPYDVGLAAGRNRLVEAAATPLVALFDDDFVCLPATDLGRLAAHVRQGRADLAGGMVLQEGEPFHFGGAMQVKDGALRLRAVVTDGEPVYVDLMPNFFVARRQALLDVPWWEPLKLSEHHAFFLDAQASGLRSLYDPAVRIDHRPTWPRPYALVRRSSRGEDCWRLVEQRYGFTRVEGSIVRAAA